MKTTDLPHQTEALRQHTEALRSFLAEKDAMSRDQLEQLAEALLVARMKQAKRELTMPKEMRE